MLVVVVVGLIVVVVCSSSPSTLSPLLASLEVPLLLLLACACVDVAVHVWTCTENTQTLKCSFDRVQQLLCVCTAAHKQPQATNVGTSRPADLGWSAHPTTPKLWCRRGSCNSTVRPHQLSLPHTASQVIVLCDFL